MTRYTITPWKHPSDLLIVRQQLYRLPNPNDPSTPRPDLRRHACDRIQAWKLRSNLPHAIESTALLIDAQLHHASALTHRISDFSIRAVYAAAFTRFVTGFCDIGRSRERGLEPSSMVAIARQIGMPAEFVALRHEATHEELPGLKRLLGAVEGALEWLWGVYWSRLEEPVRDEGGGEEVRAEVARVLKAYRKERRDALRSRIEDGGALTAGAVEECLSLCASKQAAGQIIADVLVRELLLLPTNRSMGGPLNGAYLMWDDMMQMLATQIPTFRTTVVDALFAALTKPSDIRPHVNSDKEAHASWLLHLTNTITLDQEDSLMRQCCLHPGYWTQHLGRQLLEAGDEDLRDTWDEILAASVLESVAGEEAQAVASVQKEMAERREDYSAGVDDDSPAQGGFGGWMRSPVPPTVPIGMVR